MNSTALVKADNSNGIVSKPSNNAFSFYEGFGKPNQQMVNNLNQVKLLQKEFAKVGYQIDPKVAYQVNNWFEINRQPLLVEGGPGTGKTFLALALAATKGLNYYRFQCYPGIKPKDVLTSWNKELQKLLIKLAYKESGSRSIKDIKHIIYDSDCRIDGVFARAFLDPKPSIIHLDEIDKADAKFEASLLQVSIEGKITVNETGEEILPLCGVRPRMIFTSNAGVQGMRASLSHPLLRRSKRVKLDKPSLIRQYLVLKEKFPQLPEQLVKECVMFSYQLDQFVYMEKQTDLSEVINWMDSLKQTGATQLSWDSIEANISDFAKTDLDENNLLSSVDKIFHWIKENGHLDIKELSNRIDKSIHNIDDYREKKQHN